MEKFHPYNKIIESKLEQLPGAGTDQLWNGMHAILDKKMPQEKNRPKVFGWLSWGKGLMMLGMTSVLGICSYALLFNNGNKTTDKTSQTISVSSTNTSENNKFTEKTISINADGKHKIVRTVNTNNEDYSALTAKELTDRKLSDVSVQPMQKLSEQKGGQIDRSNYKNLNSLSNLKTTDRKDQHQWIKAASTLNNITSSSSTSLLRTNNIVTLNTSTYANLDSTIHNNSLQVSRSFIDQQKFDSLVNAQTRLNLKRKEKGSYAGVVAGMDLSSVGFESMKPGVNKGVIAGYAFNERWSIETGLYWNKKRIFTTGEYFRPTNYTLPAGVTVLNVDAKNELYEWPVNVKFTVLPKKHSLFVTAGLSSYFIKSESYHYEYEYNGQYGKSYSSFKNESRNWFSVANFSLGYSHQLGSFGSVRIEPYLKLPLKDIGINNMPVFSTGLNVGFTKRILK